MEKYYKKYLKYKNKYLKKRKQIGGGVSIYNFRKSKFPIAMAEAITHGSLREHMTQHGLGTGVYGFINPTETNPGNEAYRTNAENIAEQIIIENPVILSKEWISDGEKESDLILFTALSTRLNLLCYYYFTTHNEINIENTREILRANMYFYFIDDNTCSLTSDIIVSIDEINIVINSFIRDYTTLLNLDEAQEHYILMPINYLLLNKGYDGVFNLNDDSGRTGSVKYFFDKSIDARGYNIEYKEREQNLGGLLLLNGMYYYRE